MPLRLMLLVTYLRKSGFTALNSLALNSFKIVVMFLFLICVTSHSFGFGKIGMGKTDFQSRDSRVLIFLPFYNEIKTKSTEWLVKTISESLEKYCRDRYKYKRISDKKWKRYWKKYKKRNKLKKADLYRPETASEIAGYLGADGVILGRFKKKGKNSIIISGQIISVMHGDVVGESTETSTLDANLFKASEKIALDLGAKIYRMYWPTNAGALARSAIFPGWGQFYKQRPTWGYVYSSSFVASAGFALASVIFLEKSKSHYASYSPDHVVTESGKVRLANPAEAEREFANRRAGVDQWRQLSIIGLVLTASIYIINIIDAWYFDGDYSKYRHSVNKKLGIGSDTGLGASPGIGPGTGNIGFQFSPSSPSPLGVGGGTLTQNWGLQAKLTYKI